MASVEKLDRTNAARQRGYRVRWRITLPDGTTKQRQRTVYGRDRADELAAKMHAEHEARFSGPTEEASVAEAVEAFLRTYRFEVRPDSWDRAASELKNWIGPKLGWGRLMHTLDVERDVVPLVTDRVHVRPSDDGRLHLDRDDQGEPRPVAPGTKQRTLSIVKAFFRYAARYTGGDNLADDLGLKHCGYQDETAATSNPAMVPSWSKYEQLAGRLDEIWQPRGESVWRASDCMHLLAMGAFRWSEAAGIRREDDKGRFLELRRTRLRDGTVRSIGKNKAWRREVPVTRFLRPALDRLHETSKGTWLLVSWTGNPLAYSLFAKYFRAAREDVGLDWTIHDLRHLGVSIWIASGADRFLVMKAAGHSKLDTTVGLYGHLWPRDVTSLADRVDRLDADSLRDAHVPIADRDDSTLPQGG